MSSSSTEIEKTSRDKQKAQRKGDYQEAIRCANYLGHLYAERGEYDDALEEHRSELQLAEATNDRISIAVAHRKIGEAHTALEQFDDALQHAARYLKLAKQMHNANEEERAQVTLGWTYLQQADELVARQSVEADALALLAMLARAEDALRAAFRLTEDVELMRRARCDEKQVFERQIKLYRNLSVVHMHRGEIDEAIALARSALELAEENCLLEDAPKLHHLLATHYRLGVGMQSEAKAELSRATQLIAKMHFPDVARRNQLWAETVFETAMIELDRGDIARARHLLKKIVKRLKLKDDAPEAAQYRGALDAASELGRLLALRTNANGMEAANIIEKIGDIYCGLESYRAGVDAYRDEFELIERTKSGDSPVLVPIADSIALTLKDLREFTTAIEWFSRELQLRKSDDHAGRCDVYLNMAICASRIRGGDGDAEEYCGNAAVEAEKLSSGSYDDANRLLRSLEMLKEANFMIGETVEVSRLKVRIDSARENLKNNRIPSEVASASQGQAPATSLEELSDVTDSEGDSDLEEPAEEILHEQRRRPAQRHRRNEKGEWPLSVAIIRGQDKRARKLVEEAGHPVDQCADHKGWEPLHEAAYFDRLEIVEFLLDRGARIDAASDENGQSTPAKSAAENNAVRSLRLLIERGASLTHRDAEGYNLLDHVERRIDAIARELAEKEALLGRSTEDENEEFVAPMKDIAALILRLMSEKGLPLNDSSSLTKRGQFGRQNMSTANTKAGRTASRRNDAASRVATSAYVDDSSAGDILPILPLDEDDCGLSADASPRAVQRLYHRQLHDQLEADPEKHGQRLYRTAVAGVGRSAVASDRARQKAQQAQTSFAADNDVEVQGIAALELGELAKAMKRTAGHRPPVRRAEAETKKDTYVADDFLIDDSGPGFVSHPASTTPPMTRGETRGKNKRKSFFAEEDDEITVVTEVKSSKQANDTRPTKTSGRETRSGKGSPAAGDASRRRNSPSALQRRRSSGSSIRSVRRRPSGAANAPNDDSWTENTINADSPVSVDESFRKRTAAPPKPVAERRIVRVKVRDSVLLIPVSDYRTRTVGWLRTEAEKRYAERTAGIRPQLELATLDGAILSLGDLLVDVVFSTTSAEPDASVVVVANVVEWIVPPLADRFQTAWKCKFDNLTGLSDGGSARTTVEPPTLLLSRMRAAGANSSSNQRMLDLGDAGLNYLPAALATALSTNGEGTSVETCENLLYQSLFEPLKYESGTLTALRLPGNAIGDHGFQWLVKLALPFLGELSVLNCSLNRLGSRSLHCMADAQEKSCAHSSSVILRSTESPAQSSLGLRKLQHLDLSFNETLFGSDAESTSARDSAIGGLCRLLAVLPQLTVLNLKFCGFDECAISRLGGDADKRLCDAFAGCRALRTLDMSGNRLELKHCATVMRAVARNGQLRELRMSGCAKRSIASADCDAFMEAVAQLLPQLETLAMASCRLGDWFFRSLTDRLLGGSDWPMRTLCLASNDVSYNAVAAFLDALSSFEAPMSKLEALDVSAIRLCDADAAASTATMALFEFIRRAPRALQLLMVTLPAPAGGNGDGCGDLIAQATALWRRRLTDHQQLPEQVIREPMEEASTVNVTLTNSAS